MNTRLLFVALLPLLILGGCTKETTETETTTVTKPYVAPTFPFWGTWKVINEDPMDTFKTYYVFDQNALYGVRMEEEEFGLRDLDYDIVKGERVKIHGYLEDFALSKTEADELIMSARNIIYKD